MRLTVRMAFILFFLGALGLTAAAASFSVGSDGRIGFEALLLTLELDASFVLTYADDAFATSLMLDLDETGPSKMAAEATLSGEVWELAATLWFDVPNASFADGELVLAAAFSVSELEICLLRQANGVGMAVALVPTTEGFLHSFALGLNVDVYGRVQTGSCALAFTYAAIEAGFACECADVTATATFTSDGLSELVLSAAGVGGLALGIEFGAEVHCTTSEKTLEMVPSSAAESPSCFDLYLGLVWDGPTKKLDGFPIYGLGLACEIAGVRVRGLWELDPAAIALVKAPYWALLGLVWDVAAPCNQTGEASVAFFFGEQGLFDLGEILFGLEWPIAPGWMASLAIALETSGSASVVVGWEGGF